MSKTAMEVVMRAIEEAQTLYTNPHIERFESAQERKHAGKNHLYHGDFDFGQVRYLVSYPGRQDDWSLNKNGLNYLKTSLEKGKIAAGIVLLMKGSKVIGAASILEVLPKVEAASWFDRGDGEFVWVNSTFEPTNSSSSGRYLDPDDEVTPY